MSTLKKVKNLLEDHNNLFLALSRRGLFNWMDDKAYYQLLFRVRMGYKLNLENPQTFNEKLQWLKLNDRQPIYTTMVDKCEAKKFVAERVGEKYVIPTIGVWDNLEDIDFDNLPDQYVLKTTHDSGGVTICKDKKSFDLAAAKEKLDKSLKRNYFWTGREWPYKNVKPRIIAEQLLNLDEKENVEYKLFCFDGEVKIVLVCKGEAHRDGTGVRTNDFMDENFVRIPVKILNDNSKQDPIKPDEFEELKKIATALSSGIPALRVDFYIVDHQIYVGELTFFHNSGFNQFEPKEYDRLWGNYIRIPKGEKQ